MPFARSSPRSPERSEHDLEFPALAAQRIMDSHDGTVLDCIATGAATALVMPRSAPYHASG